MLTTSMVMAAVDLGMPAAPARLDDRAAILMSIDDDDLGLSIEASVCFPAGQKAGGAVGGVGFGNRQLEMFFTPVKGQASLYQVDARWCAHEGKVSTPVFIGQTVAAYGQTATLSQVGPAGKFALQVTIEPAAARVGK